MYSIKKFVIRLIVATVLLLIAGFLVFNFLAKEFYHPIYPVILLVFFLLTLLAHVYQARLATKDIAKFSRVNLIMTFLKLIAYSAITIVFISRNTEYAIPFVITVMILYLTYTTLEVLELTKIVKKKKQ